MLWREGREVSYRLAGEGKCREGRGEGERFVIKTGEMKGSVRVGIGMEL